MVNSAAVWPGPQHLWGWTFMLYDLLRAAAVAASLAICVGLNRRQGISASRTLLVAAVSIPASIGAARLLNAIESGVAWASLGAEFLRNRGSSSYGALFACLAVVVVLTRAMRVSTLRFLDAAAPALAVGEGVSRIGCFAAGCCYGERWSGPWAVVFPSNSLAAIDLRYRGLLDSGSTPSLPVHPVQLYGVILMAFLTWGLIVQFERPHENGAVFWTFLIAYGTYRLAMIPFRTQVSTSMEAFSAVFVAAGVAGLLLKKWASRRT